MNVIGEEYAVKTLAGYVALLQSISGDAELKLDTNGYFIQVRHVQNLWPDEDPESWVLVDAVVHAMAISIGKA